MSDNHTVSEAKALDQLELNENHLELFCNETNREGACCGVVKRSKDLSGASKILHAISMDR
ncbi:MAG: hypothetical protein V6Z86_06520 [Hyphomicrobiales bacterium]